MAFNARWTEGSIVGFQENYANDVVTNVPFTLQLLRIVLLVWELCANVKHDFNIPPVCVNAIKSC